MADDVWLRYTRLQEKLEKEKISVKLFMGCEIHCEKNCMKEILSFLKNGVYPTLNGSRYVLTEFDPWTEAADAFYCVEQLLAAGYIPLIAHAERYDFINTSTACELRDRGSLIQINIYSVFEEPSDKTRNKARRLLRAKLVDFTGSDSHRLSHRPPAVRGGIENLYTNYDGEYVDAILFKNARQLLIEKGEIPMENRICLGGIMGVVIGDALGCPVQFLEREIIAERPVTTMTGHGTYDMPVGTWTDDSSMTMATLISIQEHKGIKLADIMYRFAMWLTKGEYTPFGEAFDNGGCTTNAIFRYLKEQDVTTCGGTDERDNGNGSLMRIMPACLHCYEQQETGKLSDEETVSLIHQMSGLTHNHMRAKIGCGLYYFMVREILRAEAPGKDEELIALLQKGLDRGFDFYKKDLRVLTELSHYGRLHDLYAFRDLPMTEIRSSGYVVDTLEAAVWSLLKTNTFKAALLTAVNLGDDTDTVGAICGGLAGLFYGYEDIPTDWLAVIQRREWIETLCCGTEEQKAGARMGRYERRTKNVEIFKDTSRQCRDIPQLSDSILASTRGRKLYLEKDVLPEKTGTGKIYEKPAKIVVSGKRSYEAAQNYDGKKTCVLNFASSVSPGGGVKNGSSAQEESLCRCSTLYFTLDSPQMMTKFYLPHRKAGSTLYNDDIIYTPAITVFKSDTDFPEMLPESEWYKVDVLTCAAPNLRDHDIYDPYSDHTSGAGSLSTEELQALIEKRVRRIFEVAAYEENEVLILGAFGCGAFRNPPELVAEVFRKVTEEYLYRFEIIEFAVYCRGTETENYLAFSKAFEK